MLDKNEMTISKMSDGSEIPVAHDDATFVGETWYKIALDISTESAEWDGFQIPLPALAEHEGAAAVSFDIIYRWRKVQNNVSSAEAVQSGYGQPFYVELISDDVVLDACFLDENEPLPCNDDKSLNLYGKKKVTLYIKDIKTIDDNKLAVNVFIGEPPAQYKGNVWISRFDVNYIFADTLPPEMVNFRTTPACPLTVAETAVSPVDPKLIPEAAAALAYLKGASESGRILYGMQNYLFMKGGYRYHNAPQDTNDIFDMTGKEPSMSGFDSLSLIAMEDAYRMPEIEFPSEDRSDPANIPFYIKGCALRSLKVWKTGTLSTLSLHMSDPAMVYDQYEKNNKNPVTGRAIYNPDYQYPWNFYGYGYGNSTKAALDPRDQRARSPHKPMLRMYRALTESGASRADIGVLEVFNAYLDIAADYCLILQEQGVPVLFRPFHENSGDWFWWGNSGCENADHVYNPDIFKRNWRHVVEYMYRRGVHNCIYVYSPNGTDFDNMEKQYTSEFRPYAITYPGDEWVDICGFDDYSLDENALRNDVEYVTKFAAAHGKLAAACEINGSSDNSEIIELLFRAMTDTAHLPINLSYVMQWMPQRFAPYLTSPTRSISGAANTFIKVLVDNKIVKADETSRFQPEKVAISNRILSGSFV